MQENSQMLVKQSTGLQINDTKPVKLSDKIIQAKSDKKMSDHTEDMIEMIVDALLLQAARSLGQKNIDDGVMEAAATEFKDSIMSEFRMLTHGELKIALQRGSQGVYGDDFILSSRNLHKWVRTYMKGDRIEANKKQLKAMSKNNEHDLNDPNMAKPKIKTKKEVLEFLNNRVEQLKDKKVINTSHVMAFEYEYLIQLKSDLFSYDEKWQAIDEAIGSLLSNIKFRFSNGKMKAADFGHKTSELNLIQSQLQKAKSPKILTPSIITESQKILTVQTYQAAIVEELSDLAELMDLDLDS